ncbi:MAG TPA: hypothetical protein VGP99_13745 [Tepidisphaeraceae bacterium]|nr:hypothetical protein [Tepidisphaeraceae bacterium]
MLVERIEEFVQLVERWGFVEGEPVGAFDGVDVEIETTATGCDDQANAEEAAEKESGLIDDQRSAKNGPVEQVKDGPGAGSEEGDAEHILALWVNGLKAIAEGEAADIIDADADANAAVVHFANVVFDAGDSGAL